MGRKAFDLIVDFGIRIWDCGIESFFNPHSTICNPQSAYGGWVAEVGVVSCLTPLYFIPSLL
jgi:hypothetical protein